MKKYLLFTLLFFCISCNENIVQVPCITCNDNDGPIEKTDKKILMEEFTGVHCSRCPAGSAEIENLLDIYGERLIAVSIHAGFFSTPFQESRYDFRTEEGDDLNSFLDFPDGFPTAVINRKVFENEPDLQLTPATSWSGFVGLEKEALSDITLDLLLEYNPTNRQLLLNSSISPVETITDPTHYSIMITEDGLVDIQDTENGVVEDYVHKHVLRDMMTPFNGEPIMETLSAGSVIEKQHRMTIPDEWDPNKLNVIAFVHFGGGQKEIIQAEKISLPE